MALLRNSLLTGALSAALSGAPAMADGIPNNYIYDYSGHSDSITIGLGDAPISNIIIQHPTPWPSYVNNTRIKTPSSQGINALENMLGQYMQGGGRTVYYDPDGSSVGTGSTNSGGSSAASPSAGVSSGGMSSGSGAN